MEITRDYGMRHKGVPLLKTAFNCYGVFGFGLASAFAFFQEWSLPEFCWSTWLAGLVYAWACVVSACLQIILTARSHKPSLEQRLPFISRWSPAVFLVSVIALIVPSGLIGFHIYGYLFGFFGLFLSVFAEMEPHLLFGRNGYINSDFYTPVLYLAERFWPMAVGILIANWEDLLRKDPWKRLVLPFQREIVRIHLMILALPFLSLIAWALLGESYQSLTIVLLMGLLFLLPRSREEEKALPVSA
jgi:hypothetical protein